MLPSHEYLSLGAFSTRTGKSNWKTPAAKASLWNPLPPLRGSRTFADFSAQRKLKQFSLLMWLFTALYITNPYLFLGLQHSDCIVSARQQITSSSLKLVVILLSAEHITWPFNAGKWPWAFPPLLIALMCRMGDGRLSPSQSTLHDSVRY